MSGEKGCAFSLIILRQSVLGKSAFINTLLQTELYEQHFPSTVHRKKTVTIDSSSSILKEKGVQLRLTIC